MKTHPPAQRVYTSVTRLVLIVSLIITGLFLLPDRVSRAAATFTVNSLADTPDAVQGNGICADAGGLCTLRAALQEANAFAGDDTIDFSVTGTINLTGALPTITSNIIIIGPGSASLTVRRDTGGDYRIFFIDNRIVTISKMTITNGKTPDGAAGSGQSGGPGGGIRQAGGELTLHDVIITGNRTGNGGNVSALAEDDIGTPYPLVVESVSPVTVTGLTDVTQVIVKLPDNVIGIPRDLFVKVTLRGPGSNRGRIRIAAP